MVVAASRVMNANAGGIVARSEVNGGALGAPGRLTDSTSLTATTLARLTDGLTGINFRTVTNPGSEICGQIRR